MRASCRAQEPSNRGRRRFQADQPVEIALKEHFHTKCNTVCVAQAIRLHEGLHFTDRAECVTQRPLRSLAVALQPNMDFASQGCSLRARTH